MYFVHEKPKVDAAYYVGRLSRLLVDCNLLLPGGFIF